MEQMKRFTSHAEFNRWADTLPAEEDIDRYPLMMDCAEATVLLLTVDCSIYQVALASFRRAFADAVPGLSDWVKTMIASCAAGQFSGKQDGCYYWSVRQDSAGWTVRLSLFGEYAGK